MTFYHTKHLNRYNDTNEVIRLPYSYYKNGIRKKEKMIKIKLSRLLGDIRMTQAELAQKTGIRAATINEMYHELIERVNLDYLSRICEILDCEVSDVLEYIPHKNDFKLDKNDN